VDASPGGHRRVDSNREGAGWVPDGCRMGARVPPSARASAADGSAPSPAGLQEALFYECVPIILSERMEPPFAALLDWASFSARLRESQLPSLKAFVKGLDHAKLLHGVRRAKSALEYHVGGYTGRDMLPLLLHQMHQRLAAGPVASPSNVVALHNDVDTDRDYDAGLQNDKSQCAHAVSTSAALLVDGVRWDCVSTDGYQAGCSTKGAADAARRTTARPRRCRRDLAVRGWVKP